MRPDLLVRPREQADTGRLWGSAAMKAWAICDTCDEACPPSPLVDHIYYDRETAVRIRETLGANPEHYPIVQVRIEILDEEKS